MGALLLYWLTKVLIGLFLLGLIGSAVVVVITFIEDGVLLLEADEARNKPQSGESKSKSRQGQAQEAF